MNKVISLELNKQQLKWLSNMTHNSVKAMISCMDDGTAEMDENKLKDAVDLANQVRFAVKS